MSNCVTASLGVPCLAFVDEDTKMWLSVVERCPLHCNCMYALRDVIPYSLHTVHTAWHTCRGVLAMKVDGGLLAHDVGYCVLGAVPAVCCRCAVCCLCRGVLNFEGAPPWC